MLYRGSEAEPSRSFAISPTEDLPPEVMLDAERDVLEVAVDETFEVSWRARDDYGVRSVGVAVDGQDLDLVLRRPDRRVAELSEPSEWLSPQRLGLSAGARARVAIVAYDNDTVSGSKRGASREIEVVVLGARGLNRRVGERREKLLEVMIPVLARFLTEPWQRPNGGGALASYGARR